MTASNGMASPRALQLFERPAKKATFEIFKSLILICRAYLLSRFTLLCTDAILTRGTLWARFYEISLA